MGGEACWEGCGEGCEGGGVRGVVNDVGEVLVSLWARRDLDSTA